LDLSHHFGQRESEAKVLVPKMTSDIHLHVAILVCDTPIQPVLQKYGDYFTMFQDLLHQGFELDLPREKSGEIVVECSEYKAVDNEFPDLAKVDALLLTGSSML
jgi:hypothetical protein